MTKFKILYYFVVAVFTGGFSGGSVIRIHLCREHEIDPWVRKIYWIRKWQPNPVFLPGKFHEQRSLVGPNPWGHREWDVSE